MKHASRDTVLVTLADRRYLEQAKQVFSSAYHNAGWKGDYLLLAHDVPERRLEWFRKRGILIRHCRPLYKGRPGGMAPVLATKFYMFTPEFKRWKTVIYTDADATIRASLDGLRNLKGFWSIWDASRWLDIQILARPTMYERRIEPRTYRKLVKEIYREQNIRGRPFCAGFFVFGTDLIDEIGFSTLKSKMDRYHPVSQFGDQLAFNLVFAHRWKELPAVYNIQACDADNRWRLETSKLDGIIVHYISPKKPWLSRNGLYAEWQANLDRADAVNLSRIPKGVEWSAEKIARTCEYLAGKDRKPSFLRAWIGRRVPKRFRLMTRPFLNTGFAAVRKGGRLKRRSAARARRGLRLALRAAVLVRHPVAKLEKLTSRVTRRNGARSGSNGSL